jgi:hypothetical protein
MSHQRPPICLNGALEICLGVHNSGRFEHLKCISKVPADGAPLGIASAAFELRQQPKVVSISSFIDGPSAPDPTAAVPLAPEL